ncbi:MAG: hypothetical protein ACRDNF_03070 [Streptosporangiaceae bacterium]
MTDAEIREMATPPRAITYWDAESQYRSGPGARERYDDLTGREINSRLIAGLHARGQYDPAKHGILQNNALTTDEHLEMLALGEVLARYYRHPTQLDHAVKAGATWEQIAAATDQTETQVRQEYRRWADGQHNLYVREDGKFGGLGDAGHAEAMARLDEPEPGAAERGHEAEAG